MKNKPNFREEKRFWKADYKYVLGLDEVGRGAFAGPVVVGAVAFAAESKRISNSVIKKSGINDSKLVKPLMRRKLAKIIKNGAKLSHISSSGVSVINRFGIGKATQKAFRKVISLIQKEVNSEKIFVLADGFHVPYLRGIGVKNQKGIVGGDRKSISIAAASIIAKVHRDNIMKKLHKKYPQYHFAKNKGYGTKEHQKAIKKYGLSKIHRKSFNLAKYL